MRVVVDSNALQSKELEAYLAASADNFAVLTDYVAMEAHKGDTLNQIFRSMSVVARYPRQVIVLKGTREISAMPPAVAASPRGLVDELQTQEFPLYCDHLRLAESGHQALRDQLLEHGRVASEHIDNMLGDADPLKEGFDLMARVYTADELRILRKGQPFTPAIGEKVMKYTMLLAASLFEKFPDPIDLPRGTEVRDSFIFRFAVCAHVLVFRWIEVGGAGRTKADRLRNDIVDVNFAAYGTYFDDLLTADTKAREIYLEARFMLENVFAPREP